MAICARWAKPRAGPSASWCDLQGPKIRLGTLTGGPRMLKEGEKIRLVLGETSDKPDEMPIPHPEIFQAIKQKHALLIDDGKVRLRLLTQAPTLSPRPMVEVGGEIKDRKGVNMPDTLLPHVGDDAQGPQRSGCRAGAGGGLDRAVLRAAARGCGRS